ncbi:hypothetical protein V500_02410 [Pseudogymnoascus sp. VKM F-4518 (FW-2643)]|nr:hypothetical protein V500_02410 [Pseudogymnoascus sp. VKM F-4518 (FW-2643)]
MASASPNQPQPHTARQLHSTFHKLAHGQVFSVLSLAAEAVPAVVARGASEKTVFDLMYSYGWRRVYVTDPYYGNHLRSSNIMPSDFQEEMLLAYSDEALAGYIRASPRPNNISRIFILSTNLVAKVYRPDTVHIEDITRDNILKVISTSATLVTVTASQYVLMPELRASNFTPSKVCGAGTVAVCTWCYNHWNQAPWPPVQPTGYAQVDSERGESFDFRKSSEYKKLKVPYMVTPSSETSVFDLDATKILCCALVIGFVTMEITWRQSRQEQHLRADPHRLLGDVLKATVQLLSNYELKTIEELKDQARKLGARYAPIEGLARYDGFCCLHAQCAYSTRHLPKMKEHVSSSYKVKAAEHKTRQLWKECTLQTYFVGKGRIDYFVVVDNKKEEKLNTRELSKPLKEEEKALFIKLEEDYQDVKGDIKEQASIVHDFADSKSERDEEIWYSYKLLLKKEVDGGAEGAIDPNLVCILAAAEAMLRDAYKLCSDSSPD